MIQHQGVWLPDGEVHLVDWMDKAGELVNGRGSYQITKYRAAMNFVKRFRTALDIGAHCGLWSMQLWMRFDFVHAFEPVAANRECFYANVPETSSGINGVTLHECALGDHDDWVDILTDPTSSASSRIIGPGDIPMRTLDSFPIKDIDFIKIDTEGYELFVVRGAEQTIKRWKPTMIVEQKGHGVEQHGFRKEEGIELLESWGMKRAVNLSGDWVMVWD